MPRHRARIDTIEVGEVRLRTSIRGQGRPLLLITGLGASLDFAVPFERQLSARGFEVISFDAPGIGGSTPYRRLRRLPAAAETITRLLDKLGHEQVDALGVSLGGAVAQQLARQSPDRVRSLVLAATMPGIGGLPGSPHALLPLLTPRRYRDPTFYREVSGRVFGGLVRHGQVAEVDEILGRLRIPSPKGYLGQLYAISGWSSLPWLHTLRQPTLVLSGDNDPLVPLVNARILAWRIPNGKLHVIKGGGHLFILEQPGDVAELVAGFLRQVDVVSRSSAQLPG